MLAEKNIFPEPLIYLIAEFRPVYSGGGHDLGIIIALSDEGFTIETQSYIDLTEGNILEINLKHPDSNLEIAVLGQIVSTQITWYKNIIELKFHEADLESKSKLAEFISKARSKQVRPLEGEDGIGDDQALKIFDKDSLEIMAKEPGSDEMTVEDTTSDKSEEGEVPASKALDKDSLEIMAKEPGSGEMTVEDTTSDKNEEVRSMIDDCMFDPPAPVKNEMENTAHAGPVESNIEELNAEKMHDGMPQVTNFKLQNKTERPFKRKRAFLIKIAASIVCLATALFLISNSIKQGEELVPQKIAGVSVQEGDDETQSQLNNVNSPSGEEITREPLKTATLLEDIKERDTLPLQEIAEVPESKNNTQAVIKYEDTPKGEIIAGVPPQPEPLPENMGAGGTLLEQEKTEVSKSLLAMPDIEQNMSYGSYAVSVYVLNIRENPTTESSIVGKMKLGTVFVAEGSEEKGDGLWLKIDRGYVSGMYTIELKKLKNMKSLNFTDREKQIYTVNADLLNIRSRPTVESPIMGKLKRGEVLITNETEKRDDGLWLKVDKGYVSAKYTRAGATRMKYKGMNFREKGKYAVYAHSLNIRSRPAVTSPGVGKLKRGEVFLVNGKEYREDGLWLKIDRGYVFAAYTVELHQDK
jgi:uncharacterized protein YgiM (DUF1202 family)